MGSPKCRPATNKTKPPPPNKRIYKIKKYARLTICHCRPLVTTQQLSKWLLDREKRILKVCQSFPALTLERDFCQFPSTREGTARTGCTRGSWWTSLSRSWRNKLKLKL